MRAANDCSHSFCLGSYADPGIIRMILRHHLLTPGMHGRGHLLIDSGAFSAWTRGIAIDLEEYADFLAQFTELHRDALARIQYLNLDVIGDQRASHRNWQRLRDAGLSPMPVFTYGGDLGELREMAQESPRLALGGLALMSRDGRRVTLERWLDACWEVLPSGAQVHLLGVGQRWALERYPATSCDSTQFSSQVRGDNYRRTSARHPHLSGPDLKRQMLADEIRRIQQMVAEVVSNPRPDTRMPLFDLESA